MPASARVPVREPLADPALLTHWLTLGKLTLPGEPQYVRSARTFVARTIGVRHPRADEALLLTSEFVTNAIAHSRSRLPGGTVKLVVAAKALALLISVTDDGADATVPEIRRLEYGEHGNGLLLADAIADSWGYEHNSSRTTVWFKLCARCKPPPEPMARPALPPRDYGGSSDQRPAPGQRIQQEG
jgi:anti-sigma regulatory factor (Ser/Thr protein kinase)